MFKTSHSLYLFIPILIGLINSTWANVPTLKSVAVKGTLYCGKTPADNVKVRLFRVYTDPDKNKGQNLLHETLDTRTVGSSGMFDLNANTNNRPLNETDLAPAIGIYHQCGVEKKEGYQRVLLKVPPEYVTLGKTPRKTFDIGQLNLEIKYPKETHVKEFIET